ncbi:MAG: inosine/xanthosine triphosphatase [Candidatus Bathyarchaeia archaeon]
MSNKVTVALASTNPVKIKATFNVFKMFYEEVKVIPLDIWRGVRHQPIGINEIVQGAVEGARESIRKKDNASFGVGIEAGLIILPYSSTGYGDQQFAAIIDRKEVLTIGGGAVFEYPPAVTELVLTEGVEVGFVMEKLAGIKSLGRKQGAIGYLSHGILDRVKLTEQAVLMAIIPRLNEDLYFSATRKN